MVVVAAGSILLPATTAFAQVPRPLPAGDSSNVGTVPNAVTTITTSTGGNSGVAVWAVLLIAVGAIVLGAVAAATYRTVRSHHKTGALATA
jgi:hypothetical protein